MSDVVEEIRYSFSEQRSNLQTLKLKLPSLTFFYWGIFPNLRETLTSLTLENCEKLPKIPPTIGVLLHLKELNLVNCGITDKSFPTQIAFLLNLEVLNLNSNALSKIPDEIALLPELLSLCVCSNKIKELPSWIESSPLTALCVAENKFTSFPSIIEKLSNIKLFNYSRNLIQGDYIIISKKTRKELEIISAFEVLYFSRTQFELYTKAQQIENQLYDQIPKDFICPITQSIMIDPVMTINGESYEKHAILKWFRRSSKKNTKDPLSNETLKTRKVVPNLVLSRLTRSYIENTTMDM